MLKEFANVFRHSRYLLASCIVFGGISFVAYVNRPLTDREWDAYLRRHRKLRIYPNTMNMDDGFDLSPILLSDLHKIPELWKELLKPKDDEYSRRSIPGMAQRKILNPMNPAIEFNEPDEKGKGILRDVTDMQRVLNKKRFYRIYDLDAETIERHQADQTYGTLWPLQILATSVVVPVVSLAMRAAIVLRNDFEVHGQDRLRDAVLNRSEGKALLTYSNHVSVQDDPGLMSCVIPADILINHRKMRWGGCAEEICFKTSAHSAFMGTGKVMPLLRGAGVMQGSFTRLILRANRGDWVHIFPEGHVHQVKGIDHMRWGIGRLITETKTESMVLPIYIDGMQDCLPDDPETRITRNTIPLAGKKVTVVIGEAVPVGDLHSEYQRKRRAQARQHAAHMDSLDEEYFKRATARVQAVMAEMDRRFRAGQSPQEIARAATDLAKEHKWRTGSENKWA
eukprot:Clim_evm26s158 gene=Clim_evmTU26s158